MNEGHVKMLKEIEKREDYMKRTAHMNGISDAIFYGEKKTKKREYFKPKDGFFEASRIILLEWYERGFSFGLHLKDELKKEFDIFALLDAKEIEDD